MKARWACDEDIRRLEVFFQQYVTSDLEAVYNEEFLCMLGLRAAIRRKQLVLTEEDGVIAAAARVYFRKNETISLYQFAVDPRYRGRNLMRTMLLQLGFPVYSECPAHVDFNEYYESAGWTLDRVGGGMHRWKLEGMGAQC